MDEFDYHGKTAVQALQELCIVRQWKQPLFLERATTDKSKYIITVVVNSKSYATTAQSDKGSGCESAACETLTSLLENFDPKKLKQTHVEKPADVNSINEESESHLNSISILHNYLSTLGSEASVPDVKYDKGHIDGNFTCTVTVTIRGKVNKATGNDKTKSAAKKNSYLNLLRTLFPECETFPDICTAVQEAMHQEKLAKKKGPNSQPPKSDSKISLPIAKINNKPNPPKAKQKKISTLVECVQKVANAPTNYNIELPQGATLRLATINDASAIFDLIRELADFEKEPDGVKIDLSTFRNDGWGNPNNPSFWVYVVDIDTTVHIGGTSNTNVPKSNNVSNVITVGMALFFPVYSTWEGKTLHLEDLYVKEAYRNMNIGNSLLKAIAAISVEANLLRTEWQCLHWNRPALNFYEKIGATVYSDWRVLRMNQESVRKYVGVDKSVDDSVSEVINDNSNNGSASDISFVIDRNGSDPNPPAKLSGESANMWCDKFQHAMMVSTESDVHLKDFNIQVNEPSVSSTPSHGTSTVNSYTQPNSLATFVNSVVLQGQNISDSNEGFTQTNVDVHKDSTSTVQTASDSDTNQGLQEDKTMKVEEETKVYENSKRGMSNQLCRTWLKHKYLNLGNACKGCERMHSLPENLGHIWNDFSFKGLSAPQRASILKQAESERSGSSSIDINSKRSIENYNGIQSSNDGVIKKVRTSGVMN